MVERMITLHNGDCLEVMRGMPDNSVDTVVTDPPYGLSFMGKKWDYDVPKVEVWVEALRVLKPGGHLLAFAGTRTQHRMCCNIEDAGFDIRDMLAWVYGSGFPKSLNISKAIDKEAGVVREVVGTRTDGARSNNTLVSMNASPTIYDLTAPATPETHQWDGWGTALKPALEPITLARKPIAEKTIAKNILAHGTGGLNIDGCRVGLDGVEKHTTNAKSGLGNNVYGKFENVQTETLPEIPRYNTQGRFPANLIHDGSDEVVALFPDSKGQKNGGSRKRNVKDIEKHWGQDGGGYTQGRSTVFHNDSGSAARFFYCPKTSKADRNEGCENLRHTTAGDMVNRAEGSAGIENPRAGAGRTSGSANNHPTVKPTALMQYLVRLVTPPGGIVLDPFMGSGSTGKACVREDFRFIGIELDPEYYRIAEARIGSYQYVLSGLDTDVNT